MCHQLLTLRCCLVVPVAPAHLEVLACRLIVHDVRLAGAVHGVGDLLTSTALVQADLRHTWQQAQGAGGAHTCQLSNVDTHSRHSRHRQAAAFRVVLQSCAGCSNGWPMCGGNQLCIMVLSAAGTRPDLGVQPHHPRQSVQTYYHRPAARSPTALAHSQQRTHQWARVRCQWPASGICRSQPGSFCHACAAPASTAQPAGTKGKPGTQHTALGGGMGLGV